MPSWLPKVPSWLRKNALCLSQSALCTFAPYVIKTVIFCEFVNFGFVAKWPSQRKSGTSDVKPRPRQRTTGVNNTLYHQIKEISFELRMETILMLMIFAGLLCYLSICATSFSKSLMFWSGGMDGRQGRGTLCSGSGAVLSLGSHGLSAILTLRSLSNPDNNSNKNATNIAYLTMKNNSFVHFTDVLVLSTTWNDPFWSCVDDEHMMTNFVVFSQRRWFQLLFNSGIVRSHFASIKTLINSVMIAETRSCIFWWGFQTLSSTSCLL